MNIVDRQAIEDLFTRLKDAEQKGGPRDPEAEALIARLVSRQPAAAYYLAQTVLVQQWALNAAQDHIENLERSAGGGLLAALFGGGRRAPRREWRPRSAEAAQPEMRTGFLAGASQTALGVAGGFLLADLIAHGSFTDQSLAAGFAPEAPAADAGASVADDLGGGFGGGDFGGDIGGGF